MPMRGESLARIIVFFDAKRFFALASPMSNRVLRPSRACELADTSIMRTVFCAVTSWR